MSIKVTVGKLEGAVHQPATGGDGIHVSSGQIITNIDKGSTAVALHENMYNHSIIHTHANKSHLDTIDQALAKTNSPQWRNLELINTTGNTLHSGTWGTLIAGYSNTTGNGTQNNVLVGDNNTLGTNSVGSIVCGKYNNSNALNSFVFGQYNTAVFGNYYCSIFGRYIATESGAISRGCLLSGYGESTRKIRVNGSNACFISMKATTSMDNVIAMDTCTASAIVGSVDSYMSGRTGAVILGGNAIKAANITRDYTIYGNGIRIGNINGGNYFDIDNTGKLMQVGTAYVGSDLKFLNNTNGIILKDRTTGTYYRTYVDNGELKIETI